MQSIILSKVLTFDYHYSKHSTLFYKHLYMNDLSLANEFIHQIFPVETRRGVSTGKNYLCALSGFHP